MSELREYPFIKEGQPGSELFTFVVKASDLLTFARVERFNESEEGVQRRLNIGHTRKIAEYMRQPDASLAEPIVGDLRGGWGVNTERNVLQRQREAYLLVDDGQHCLGALHLLSPEERDKWEFKVTATVDTPRHVRLKRFIQQLKRLKLDTQLVLQIQDQGDLFPDAISKASYQLAKRLAIEPSSPLCGLLRLQEREMRRLPGGADLELLAPLLNASAVTQLREQTIGIINVTGILRDLRQVVASPHSFLRFHKPEEQFVAICRILSAAREHWSTEWADPKNSFLRRSEGVAALLELFVVGQAFKTCLSPQGTRWNKRVTQRILTIESETITRVLGYAKRYDWSFAHYRKPGMKFPGPVEIARQLDTLIYQIMPKSFREKRSRETANV